jgi:hypothetical protein
MSRSLAREGAGADAQRQAVAPHRAGLVGSWASTLQQFGKLTRPQKVRLLKKVIHVNVFLQFDLFIFADGSR